MIKLNLHEKLLIKACKNHFQKPDNILDLIFKDMYGHDEVEQDLKARRLRRLYFKINKNSDILDEIESMERDYQRFRNQLTIHQHMETYFVNRIGFSDINSPIDNYPLYDMKLTKKEEEKTNKIFSTITKTA